MFKAIELLDLASKAFTVDDNKVVKVDGRVNKTIVNLSKNIKSKELIYMPNIKTTKKPIFLISNTKNVISYLKQVFIKALIFQRFDLKSHI